MTTLSLAALVMSRLDDADDLLLTQNGGIAQRNRLFDHSLAVL